MVTSGKHHLKLGRSNTTKIMLFMEKSLQRLPLKNSKVVDS